MTGNSDENRNHEDSVERQSASRIALRKIDRARSRLVVCFYTLPLYAVALVLLLNNGRSINVFMFVYMALYAVFAIDMTVKRCPSCGEQFFVDGFFLKFFARKCVHCGQPSREPDYIHDNDP